MNIAQLFDCRLVGNARLTDEQVELPVGCAFSRAGLHFLLPLPPTFVYLNALSAPRLVLFVLPLILPLGLLQLFEVLRPVALKASAKTPNRVEYPLRLTQRRGGCRRWPAVVLDEAIIRRWHRRLWRQVRRRVQLELRRLRRRDRPQAHWRRWRWQVRQLLRR